MSPKKAQSSQLPTLMQPRQKQSRRRNPNPNHHALLHHHLDLNVRDPFLLLKLAVYVCQLDGLPSILELLRVLINVLDPTDQQHTDSTRLVALGALNVAFEESGSCIIRFPSLEALIVDHGCKFLFQLARSDNPYVLQAALRTIATVFDTMRPRLKLQLELFLAFTMDRLAPAPPANKAQASMARSSGVPTSPYPSTPILGAPPKSEAGEGAATPTRVLVAPARGETRDQILETLSQLSRKSSFMVDLYSNYDCDINCENMFERLIDFLTKVGATFTPG